MAHAKLAACMYTAEQGGADSGEVGGGQEQQRQQELGEEEPGEEDQNLIWRAMATWWNSLNPGEKKAAERQAGRDAAREAHAAEM